MGGWPATFWCLAIVCITCLMGGCTALSSESPKNDPLLNRMMFFDIAKFDQDVDERMVTHAMSRFIETQLWAMAQQVHDECDQVVIYLATDHSDDNRYAASGDDRPMDDIVRDYMIGQPICIIIGVNDDGYHIVTNARPILHHYSLEEYLCIWGISDWPSMLNTSISYSIIRHTYVPKSGLNGYTEDDRRVLSGLLNLIFKPISHPHEERPFVLHGTTYSWTYIRSYQHEERHFSINPLGILGGPRDCAGNPDLPVSQKIVAIYEILNWADTGGDSIVEATPEGDLGWREQTTNKAHHAPHPTLRPDGTQRAALRE